MKAAALVLTLALAVPAGARWTEVPDGVRVPVAKQSGLSVTPGPGWNRNSWRPSRKGEQWSLNGPLLDRVEFMGAIATGEPLARERDRKRRPLPHVSVTWLPTDIARAFEETQRIVHDTPDFEVDLIEPATFAGRPGVRFTYRYTVRGEELTRRGEARAAMIDKQLYLISYTAAALHYFDAHLAKARAVMDSAVVD